jgi:hypothetical protein
MPYSSIKDIPEYIKKYDEVIQRQWLHVFNSIYAKENGDEARAFRAANSVLKKRFTGKKSMEKNSREDYFSNLVDQFLGNLNG